MLSRRVSLRIVVITAAGLACNNSTQPVILVPGAVSLAPSDTSIPQFGNAALRVSVLDTAGHAIPLRPEFTWSDSTLVSVSAEGVVRSLGPRGTATITASLGVLSAHVAVLVFDSSLAYRTSLGGRPYGAAIWSAGVAYVTQLDLALASRVNLPSKSFDASVSVGNVPTEITFNTAGTRAYVTNQFDAAVGVVDVATNTEIDLIPVMGDPFEVIVAPGDSILYVSTNVDSVYGIRLATKATVVAFGVPNVANGFALRDTLLYASTRLGGTVVEFNLRTRTVSRTLAVGGEPQKLALSSNGTQLYIASESGYVQFWDLTTGAQIGSNLVLPLGRGYGIALNPANGMLYASSLSGGVYVIDPTSRTIVRQILVGGIARRVVFNTSGSVGLVPNESGWVDFLK